MDVVTFTACILHEYTRRFGCLLHEELLLTEQPCLLVLARRQHQEAEMGFKWTTDCQRICES